MGRGVDPAVAGSGLRAARVLVAQDPSPAAWSPLVVRADGTAEYLDLEPSRLLGLGPTNRQCETFALNRGDTIVLFTDGLVERRTRDLTHGLELLRAAVADAVRTQRWSNDAFAEVIERLTAASSSCRPSWPPMGRDSESQNGSGWPGWRPPAPPHWESS